MPFIRVRRTIALLLSISLLTFALACGGDDDDLAEDENDNTGGDAPAAVAYTSKNNEGSVAGSIAFNGTAAERKAISMDADPACSASNPNRSRRTPRRRRQAPELFVYVKDGKLTDGTRAYGPDLLAPSPDVVLDRRAASTAARRRHHDDAAVEGDEQRRDDAKR